MILLKAFHDAGDRLKQLLSEESLFAMIGVSVRFLNPGIEKYIHNFWTVESSRNDKKVMCLELVVHSLTNLTKNSG